MVIIGMILGIVCGIGSLICWVMTLIKMFGDEERGGVGKGIGGIICGLYAFIWGWQNHTFYPGHDKIMKAWTGCFIGSILANVIQAAGA